MRSPKLLLTVVFLIGSLSLVGLVLSPQTKNLFQKGQVLTQQMVDEEEPLVEEDNPEAEATPSKEAPNIQKAGTFLVLRVVDGDTVELDNGQKLRYIGIDTPETVDPRKGVQCFGKEAAIRNKELVEGKLVRLEKDVSDTDHYGRLLRYVYTDLEGGEVMVNDQLVREGFAHSSPFPPDIAKQTQLDEAESDARTNNRGLWSSCPL